MEIAWKVCGDKASCFAGFLQSGFNKNKYFQWQHDQVFKNKFDLY